MPTFCRHGRFIERCPICSKTLPGNESAQAPRRAREAAGRAGAPAGTTQRARGRRGGEGGMRVRREERSADDGYRSQLVPGLRASADALRLAQEIEFAAARLEVLAADPPGLYSEARALAGTDLERATWACFLSAYLSPLSEGGAADHDDGVPFGEASVGGDAGARIGEVSDDRDAGARPGEASREGDPFASVRAMLAAAPGPDRLTGALDPDELALGPRAAHERGRGQDTLRAYAQWVQRVGAPDGTQARAFTGDGQWTAERRFERVFERLSLPGFGRGGRFELLVTLGALGVYPLAAGSLRLAGAHGAGDDQTTLAAKRVFGIGDAVVLERRAGSLAAAAGVPVAALDLALANWIAPVRATQGAPPDSGDAAVLERAREALGA